MSQVAAPSRLAALRQDRLRWVLAAIAVVTAVSGLTQLLVAGTLLELLGAESTPTTRHLFAIVGMFMVVVGSVTLHAVLAPVTPTYVIGWAALQKAGAGVAVAAGVASDLFGGLALLVAGFDLLTAVLTGVLWLRVRERPS